MEKTKFTLGTFSFPVFATKCNTLVDYTPREWTAWFLPEVQFLTRGRSARVLQNTEGKNHTLPRCIPFLHDPTILTEKRPKVFKWFVTANMIVVLRTQKSYRLWWILPMLFFPRERKSHFTPYNQGVKLLIM
jgi:hypothetical protein